MTTLLHNRIEAGQLLASRLTGYANCPYGIVLALPRGGVPVAFEIARKLQLPLDVCLVRKLGVPGHKELAMGAIASNDVTIVNRDVVNWLHISPETIEQVAEQEKKELARRDRAYRGNRPYPEIRDRTVILVDDGIATGATMRAAIAALRQQQPKEIVVAVPVAAPSVCQELRTEVDKLICLRKPEPLHSISLWYEDFSQTTDEEVRDLLERAECELMAMK
ncbi:putative phosphoribosyltransferase [Pleurocapsa sp. PCC 7327]|uniref:phosphoribosyltransferase n=1 Tax=Pleurocapsa sp. PCC 7327 TaxID=118163 RepID=UPI00029F8F5B|nr:phosphoribosyltransferase [Pleurocapsa sp. PCC 7327]AFY75845.1 putative phosphoribosyltransferase [Pleurocapsa sp. PCC 7327]